MLPAKNRLNLTFRKKQPKKEYIKTANEDFALTFQKNQQNFKAAVKVSKKVAKKAVDRNRIKRTTTEAIKELELKEGELQITVKRNIATLKTQQVKQILKKLTSKKIYGLATDQT